jgi:CheY-like chemotaxis protein
MFLPRTAAAGAVVFVDDEDLVRLSTEAMLTELGHEVFDTESAKEALRLARDDLRPNLLAGDHLMPGTNETDLVRA